jgi:hypothetical protein
MFYVIQRAQAAALVTALFCGMALPVPNALSPCARLATVWRSEYLEGLY